VEAIFGLAEDPFVASTDTGWTNPTVDPTPLTEAHVFSIPFYSAVQKTGSATTVQQVAPGDDFAVMLATHDGTGVYGYDLVESATAPDGTSAWRNWASVNLASRAEISANLPRAVQSTVAITDRVQEAGFVAGGLAWLGPFNSSGEMVYIEDVDYQTWQITLRRGVLDTVPRPWPGGTKLWALRPDMLGLLNDERSGSVTLRGLTKTGNGRLPVDDASGVSGSLDGRLHRPYRPANLRAFGELWPSGSTYPSYPVNVTWDHRDRLTEVGTPFAWSASGSSPESGVDYEVRVEGVDENDNVLGTIETVTTTGTSHAVEETAIPSNLAGSPFIRVTVTARRDGLDSWTSPSVRFRGPFRAPTNGFAIYKDPTAPTDFNVIMLPSE